MSPAPPLVAAVLAAAEWAGDILAAPEVEARWAEPSALDGYTIGGLAGHLLAATKRGVRTLDIPPPDGAREIAIVDAFLANRIATAVDQDDDVHPLLRADGARRAEAGHRAVVEAFRAASTELARRLPGEDLDRQVPLVRFPDGSTPLRGYLETRCLELVVHGDDLAVSAGLDATEPPADAAGIAIAFLVAMARTGSGDTAVLRALARRERGDVEVLRAL